MRTDIETLGGISHWHTPVKTVDDLPMVDVGELTYCFVEDIEEVMVYQGGGWGLAQAQEMPDQH